MNHALWYTVHCDIPCIVIYRALWYTVHCDILCIVIYRALWYTYGIRTKKCTILRQSFNLIIVSSTCFEHPSVHPQEDLYMQCYGISFMRPYKQCFMHTSCHTPDCLYGCMKYQKLNVQAFLRMNTWTLKTF